MRRADRLFLIIHALRGRRSAMTAQQLAGTLHVSLRTIYRDVADLQLSGVPIEGEAGIGYVLRKGSDIPPLMFNADELEALVVGTRFVRAFGGERLGVSASAALLKIEAVLPPELRERSRRTRIYAPELDNRIEASGMIDRLHAAAVPRPVRQRNRPRSGAAMPDLLGRQLDAWRVVPAARGFPQFQAGQDRRDRDDRGSVLRDHWPRFGCLSAGCRKE
jgi:biotin operon repressor